MPITAQIDLMNPLLKEIRRNPALAVDRAAGRTAE
jgi:hypothetical protein